MFTDWVFAVLIFSHLSQSKSRLTVWLPVLGGVAKTQFPVTSTLRWRLLLFFLSFFFFWCDITLLHLTLQQRRGLRFGEQVQEAAPTDKTENIWGFKVGQTFWHTSLLESCEKSENSVVGPTSEYLSVGACWCWMVVAVHTLNSWIWQVSLLSRSCCSGLGWLVSANVSNQIKLNAYSLFYFKVVILRM